MADAKSRVDGLTTYEQWVAGQGIPVISEFSIPNLKELAVGDWQRLGARGTMIALQGAEDVSNAYILEMEGGGSVQPERHVYEEIVYVLSGRGATTVWNEGGPKRTFEWHEGSLFAVPLNAWHQFFNARSDAPARFYVVSSAPLVMNLYHNQDYIFNNSFIFTDRFDGRQGFFSADGQELPARVWETNFVEDVRTFPLLTHQERGGGVSRKFELADSTLTAHVSQFPLGTYKMAHRHGGGANVIIVQGQGYSLLWQEGKEEEQVRVDWKEGSVLVPPEMWFHQHFNTGGEPAKYLAIRWGSRKYPLFKNTGKQGKVDVSLKAGGNQIEYEDEDPKVLRLFEERLAENGVPSQMAAVLNKRSMIREGRGDAR